MFVSFVLTIVGLVMLVAPLWILTYVDDMLMICSTGSPLSRHLWWPSCRWFSSHRQAKALKLHLLRPRREYPLHITALTASYLAIADKFG